MNGKTIRIHLVNGLPSEILTAEVINWTGIIIVAPRSMLAELAKREEVKRTGVYCLLGPDPENPAQDKVYVGGGDNVSGRTGSWRVEGTSKTYQDWHRLSYRYNGLTVDWSSCFGRCNACV